jgi:hypothetical protein
VKTFGPLIFSYLHTTALTRNVQPAAYSGHLRRVGRERADHYRDGIAVKVWRHRFLFVMRGGAEMRQAKRDVAEARAELCRKAVG